MLISVANEEPANAHPLSHAGRWATGILSGGMMFAAAYATVSTLHAPAAHKNALGAVQQLDELSSTSTTEAAVTTTEAASTTAEDVYPGWPCKRGEEIFIDRCFVSCDHATNGEYPHRQEVCQCCKEAPCDLSNSSNYILDCKFATGLDGTPWHFPELPDCAEEDEELYEGLCYKQCKLLTAGHYPIRTGMNTCSNGNYGGNWTMGFGICSGFGIGGTKCLPHIPGAEGTGFKQESVGHAPMGWQVLPVPNALKVYMQGAPPEVQAQYEKLKKKAEDVATNPHAAEASDGH